MKNNRTYIITAMCVIFIIGCFAVMGINRAESYDTALELLQNGECEQALERFTRLGDYREARILANYAKAVIYSTHPAGSGYSVAKTYISRIESSYDGEFAKEIAELKRVFS